MVAKNDNPNRSQRDSKRIISYLLNVLLAGICTLLVLQNRQLKSDASNESGSILEPGTKAETFHYRKLYGGEAIFEYTDSEVRYFFFVFTTTCPHCQNSLSEVQELVDLTIDEEDVKILGVSLDSPAQTRDYFVENKLRFPLISVDDDFVRKYRSFSVPMFILLKGDGIVENTWRGEMNSDRRKEILALLTEPKVAAQEELK